MKKVKNDNGYFFGTAKVGEKGQIVIPQEARNLFDIQPGTTVIILGDGSKGIYIAKSSIIKEFAVKTLSNVGILKNKR